MVWYKLNKQFPVMGGLWHCFAPMNRDTQSFLAPSDSIPTTNPPPWRRRRVAQASASEPWRDADQPWMGYVCWLYEVYAVILYQHFADKKNHLCQKNGIPVVTDFLREIHHYRTQKSPHFFCTVLLEQKSVVFAQHPHYHYC